MVSYLLNKLKEHEHGASIIEFALILPILLALVIGIIEFGWIFTGYITLTGAAREGARLAARGAEVSEINSRVINHADTFINIQGGTINPPTISDGYRNSIPQGGEITVTVNGKLPLLIDFTGSIIPFPSIGENGLFPLSAEATMRREY